MEWRSSGPPRRKGASSGAHFYYAIVTEADGDRLWSGPVWVNQG